MKSAEDQIMELQQNIGNIQHFSDDGIRRARQEASKRRASDTKASADRQAGLQSEVGTARAQLAKVRKELWAAEAELRKVRHVTYADNVALPAFARHTPAVQQSIAGPTAANLPQRIRCCGPLLGQTDGQTDGRTPYRFIDPAPHTVQAVPITYTCCAFVSYKTFPSDQNLFSSHTLLQLNNGAS